MVRQVGRVNYLVAMPERRKKEGVFHGNTKKWREPVSPVYFVMEAVDEEDKLETLTWDGGEDGEPKFGSSCWRARGEH